ncbi:TrbI F-type domain-containing protein [Sphingomonas sp. BIUV-7]|uniref:TrbI F-type domain-containing protein n=1 Tax=Sphingomonas natans TaxID=3063330 RepID=A0ABT8Y7X9_9SPHN|nr:TrbI F-type domain-containing protein [Sphingomonas sp. BIUV-7]MDO6414410.1 TrbI F-type domain-containing protein [Sphingomonas sp. BIUV-7]
MNALNPPRTEWATEDPETDQPLARQPRTFAGFRVTSIAVVAAFALLLAWNIWQTKKILALEKRQLVSVSLQGLITDFVLSESRRGGTPEETARKTKAYLDAVQMAVTRLGANGTPVLVSEAVVGRSIPDATPVVKAAVEKAMGLAPSAASASPTAIVMPSFPVAPTPANEAPAAPSPAPDQLAPPAQSPDPTSAQGSFDGQR